jgi:AcrR family transcriptional regulator
MAKTSAAAALSRETVTSRALSLADTEGLAAVTIRRLGQEFGVTPMALYWHFQNKEELLDAMGDALFDSVATRADDGPWHQQLRALFDDIAVALREHPGSATLAFRRIMACPAGQALTENALRILAEAGFPTRVAANLASQGLMTIVALVANEPGTQPGLDGVDLEAHLAEKRARVRTLPADRFPHVLAALDDLLDCDDPDEFYAFSLDLFIAGAQAMQRKLVPV